MDMSGFSANLSTLFTEVPLLERFALASACGFSAVEIQYPYEVEAGEIGRRLDALGQSIVSINAPLGREPKRRGLAAATGHREAFRTTFLRGLEYATRLQCDALHVLSGISDGATRGEVAEATWLGNVAWAADEAADAGLMVLIEALNPVDVPGYFIESIEHAISLIERVGHPHLKLLFDTYHCEMAGADCSSKLAAFIDHIGHVQIADCPGRAEPGTGSIDWRRFFGQLKDSGYRGAVGCEFYNRQDAPLCFDWINEFIDNHRPEVELEIDSYGLQTAPRGRTAK